MPKNLPSQRYLKSILRYDPSTGLWQWRRRMSGRAAKGQIAGHRASDGRLFIRINGELYLSHRLAFVYMLGRAPHDQVDHTDHKPGNNKWSNLRDATNRQNAINKKHPRSDSTSKITGVYPYQGQRWRAKIVVNGKQIYLGLHKTKKAAAAAYRAAAAKYFGEFSPN